MSGMESNLDCGCWLQGLCAIEEYVADYADGYYADLVLVQDEPDRAVL